MRALRWWIAGALPAWLLSLLVAATAMAARKDDGVLRLAPVSGTVPSPFDHLTFTVPMEEHWLGVCVPEGFADPLPAVKLPYAGCRFQSPSARRAVSLYIMADGSAFSPDRLFWALQGALAANHQGVAGFAFDAQPDRAKPTATTKVRIAGRTYAAWHYAYSYHVGSGGTLRRFAWREWYVPMRGGGDKFAKILVLSASPDAKGLPVLAGRVGHGQ